MYRKARARRSAPIIVHGNESAGHMKLALGPPLYYWPRERMLRFYAGIAGAPVDIVYLGETVCSRRHELRLQDWLDIAEQLAAAGKEVVLSTQVLIESESDLKTLRRIAANGRFLVEANDMGAVSLMAGAPFVASPHLNVFNPHTLAILAACGAARWVAPLEMSRTALAAMQRARPAGMQTELFGYGRLPLAFSARCFTARRHNLQKDSCEFSCIQYPDGLDLQTQEGQPFLVLNGVQTQSAHVQNLIAELDALAQDGIDVLRISPQSEHTLEIISLFRQCLAHSVSADEATRQIGQWMPARACNGYWHGKPGIEQVNATSRI